MKDCGCIIKPVDPINEFFLYTNDFQLHRNYLIWAYVDYVMIYPNAIFEPLYIAENLVWLLLQASKNPRMKWDLIQR